MQLEISFRHMAHSDAVEQAVRERADKLLRFHPRITNCRVVIEASNRKNSSKAVVYRVRIGINVPGAEVVAEREPSLKPAHEDINVAIHEAFDSARRELQDLVGRMRWDVKQHEPHPRGKVVRIFPERGYGFLESPDGYEVYFHENAVVEGAFANLAVGDEVRFEEAPGENGPQATTVTAASSKVA
jgi:ribosomal subunit interface protein